MFWYFKSLIASKYFMDGCAFAWCDRKNSGSEFRYKTIYLLFCITGVWTPGFMLARQVLSAVALEPYYPPLFALFIFRMQSCGFA
jgi:hypothetical protein